MTFCDTAGSRMPRRSWQRSHDCHARQIGHRARLPAIRKLPAASHCCIPSQHATTRPYLPCQHVPRRPGRSRCTRPQTPSAMSSLSNENSRNGPANASRPFRTMLTGRAASASLLRRLHRRTLQPACPRRCCGCCSGSRDGPLRLVRRPGPQLTGATAPVKPPGHRSVPAVAAGSGTP
jgi:hypothetical protein